MIRPRGIVVSVGFDDLLAITLPRNLMFLENCLVITSPDDERTKEVARSLPSVTVFETDAFTRHGAAFNKGLAMEEGLDALGREGWLLILDADTLLPDDANLSIAHEGYLYGARRRCLDDASRWHPSFDWRLARSHNDDPAVGYFQLFHASSRPIRDKRPWYDVTFAHAGGCDAHFLDLWPPRLVRKMPFEVLHLGPVATNWFQRSSPRLDGEPIAEAGQRRALMDSLIKRFDWWWARPDLEMDEIEELPETPHRVEVPGYARSQYEVPLARPRRRRRGTDWTGEDWNGPAG